jgi:putative DNA primase/helicase
MMERTSDTDYAILMGEVARKLLGAPTSKYQGGLEWRYGRRGSLSIDLRKGAYFDHESAQGGGVLDLIIREIGGARSDAMKWLNDNRMIAMPSAKSNGQATKQAPYVRHDHDGADAKPKGNGTAARRIVATYNYDDEHGSTLYQVLRYDPKDFRRRRPDGHGGWFWNVEGVKQVPYRLTEDHGGDGERTLYFYSRR